MSEIIDLATLEVPTSSTALGDLAEAWTDPTEPPDPYRRRSE
jgi:hypothetical protein